MRCGAGRAGDVQRVGVLRREAVLQLRHPQPLPRGVLVEASGGPGQSRALERGTLGVSERDARGTPRGVAVGSQPRALALVHA